MIISHMTIIRDSHGLDELDVRTFKTVGMLNLIEGSGYLRASRRLISYAIGQDTGKTPKGLEINPVITYREYADEYGM